MNKDCNEILYSIIVPAYNEAEHLPESLRRMKLAMDEVTACGEIIVVDNNSTDGTGALALAQGAKVVWEEHRQISVARNRGAVEAQGKYLIFVDADTWIDGKLLGMTLDALESGKCSGGGALVRFPGNLPLVSRLIVRIWNRLSRSCGLAAGCYVFARRELFAEVGGFSRDLYAGEELTLSRRLAGAGRKRGMHFMIITETTVMTSARKSENHSSFKLLVMMLLLGMFPFLRRRRGACFLWYGCRHKDEQKRVH